MISNFRASYSPSLGLQPWDVLHSTQSGFNTTVSLRLLHQELYGGIFFSWSATPKHLTRTMNVSTVDELAFCSNDTCQDVQLMSFAVFLYVFRTAVIILTVCGNLLVIISISHFKQLHTPTNFLILSLATADMMVGVTVMPLQFITKTLCWHMSTTLCYFSLLCSFHFTFVSIYNVTLISLDRFFALSNPFQYSNNITLKVTSVLICLNWSFHCA